MRVCLTDCTFSEYESIISDEGLAASAGVEVTAVNSAFIGVRQCFRFDNSGSAERKLILHKCFFERCRLVADLRSTRVKFLASKSSFELNGNCLSVRAPPSPASPARDGYLEVADCFFRCNQSLLRLKHVRGCVKFQNNVVRATRGNAIQAKACHTLFVLNNLFERHFGSEDVSVEAHFGGKNSANSFGSLPASKLQALRQKANDPALNVVLGISSSMVVQHNRFVSNQGSLITIKQLRVLSVRPIDQQPKSADRTAPCRTNYSSVGRPRQQSSLQKKLTQKRLPRPTPRVTMLSAHSHSHSHSQSQSAQSTRSTSNCLRSRSSYLSIMQTQGSARQLRHV